MVLLCLLHGLAAPAALARPTAVEAEGREGSGTGAEVARLFAQAASVTRQYETGLRAARAQQVRAERLEGRLARKRAELAVLRRDLGRIARDQYRTGGQLPQIARLLLATRPVDLMRGAHAGRRTGRSVGRAFVVGRGVERRLAAKEKRAVKAWRRLDRRSTRLATLKAGIEARLEVARDRLQGEAEQSVAAGECPPAVSLRQPADALWRFAAVQQQRGAGSTATWVLPVDHYRLSAGFDSAGAHWVRRHTGLDFAVDIGTPVRAVSAGRVISVACGGPFGIQIVVQHPDGYATQYAHLSALGVVPGQKVATGQWIAESGSTGNSTGPHLHFEVRRGSGTASAIDPVAWLTERGIRP